MRHMIMIGLAVLMFAGSASAASKLELVEAEGFAEPVQVSDYDAEKSTVRLITPAGIEEKPLSEFSDPVQQKILGWYEDYVFMSSSGLQIKIKMQEKKNEIEGKWENGEIVSVNYIITLQNRSEVSLKDITLTCRVYIDQWNELTRDDDLQMYTEFSFSSDLPAGEAQIFKTKTIPVRDYVKKEITWSGDQEGHISIQVEDKLLGMSLTVEKKSFEGKTLIRTENAGRPPKEKKRQNINTKTTRVWCLKKTSFYKEFEIRGVMLSTMQ